MKLAIVTTQRYVSSGGSEELWIATADAALRRGWEVLFINYDWPELPPSVQALIDAGARRASIPFGDTDTRTPWNALETFSPDMVLVSNARVFEIMLHPALVECIERCGFPYALVNFGEGTVEPAHAAVAQRIYGNARATGFCSRHSIRQAEASLPAKLQNAFIVQEPINLTDRTPLPFPDAADGLRLASVSRLHLQKGFNVLFESLASPEVRRFGWRLSIFGDGEHRGEIEDMIARLSLGDRVELMGATTDIRGIWRNHHAFVLASPSEGVPLSMMEAMICGRPSIVTNAGGIGEWMGEGREGFIAEGIDRRSYTAALVRALSAASDWERVGTHAREMALDRVPEDAGSILLEVMFGL
ncbi:MAG: glycosyltransferase family 4 protein [Verrucomicrobia bacterium]|nr:glycosyltransferase family 4 protein [Verrucomicrobiota bacterium]